MFGSLEECNYFVVPSSYSPWVRTSSCNSTQAVPLKQINALNQTFLSYKANDSISLACQRTLLNPISIPQYTFFVSISICVHLPVQKFLEILDSLTFRFTPLVHFAPLCSTHSRSSSLPISSSRWFSSMRCELTDPPPSHPLHPTSPRLQRGMPTPTPTPTRFHTARSDALLYPDSFLRPAGLDFNIFLHPSASTLSSCTLFPFTRSSFHVPLFVPPLSSRRSPLYTS